MTNKELAILLEQLKVECEQEYFHKSNLIASLNNLLEWLISPVNCTDKNCRTISLFVVLEIMPSERYDRLPEDIKNILFDMGSSLDGSFTAPDIAENFDSTPQQLRVRIQYL